MSLSAYEQLESKYERISHLNHVLAIVGWDESVMMPAGGGQARGEALAECKALVTELMHQSDWPELLERAKDELTDADPWKQANLRELHRSWKLANCVSPDLVARSARAASRCEQAWREKRAANDWEGMRPLLEEVLTLKREEAHQRAAATGLAPYDTLIDMWEPGERAAPLQAIFTELRSFLPGFIQDVLERQQSPESPEGPFPVLQQSELGREVMEAVGFDFQHGRLDVSHHPFCGGVPQDVRITTRYAEGNFVEALMGVIHETGHARYEQRRPQSWLNQPVGSARGMGVHESQSLLFEMQVGRSPEFLRFLVPLLHKHLPQTSAWDAPRLETLYRQVKPDYIRVNADEVTYPLHVILRFELERQLIEGSLEVADLPEAWDALMRELLGLPTGDNHRDGCLQDIHWMIGAFGYFPSYTLGALLAAQLFAAMKRERPTLPQEIEHGDFSGLNSWLEQHVWSQGSLYETPELIERASGEALNAKYFVEHLKARY